MRKMPYFKNQGANLYYEDNGQGNPLVFLHGATWDMRQWKRQVEHFLPEYRVITLGARGHGKSSLPPGEVPSNVFLAGYGGFIRFLGYSKATICGLSIGGHVALQTAIHAYERTEGII